MPNSEDLCMQAHTYVSVLQKCAQPILVCIHGTLQHVRAQARLLTAAQATLPCSECTGLNRQDSCLLSLSSSLPI